MPSDPAAPRLLQAGPPLAIGTYRNIQLSVWRGDPTVAAVAAGAASMQRLLADYPQGIVVLSIIEEGAGIPGEEERRAIAAMMDRLGTRCLCMAGVQEATGFRAAAVRSVMTALDLLVRSPYPRKTFGAVPEAAAWIAARSGPPPLLASSLVSVVAMLRREIAQAP